MKNLKIILLAVSLGFTSANFAQQNINQTFENLEAGTNVITMNKGKFASWQNGTWTVEEKEGKGHNNSDKYIKSNGKKSINIVKYVTLKAGETYTYVVSVKVDDIDQSWKGNYTVTASSGKKGDTVTYGKEEIKDPATGVWKTHKISFTVEEGKEVVALQVYRWAEGVSLKIDDFKLIKG